MKHLPSSLHLASLAFVSLLTSGCITITDGSSTPFGSDVSLDGLWDVNGDVPTEESCGDIDTVRVAVCWDAAGNDCYTTGSLIFDCADGEFGRARFQFAARPVRHDLPPVEPAAQAGLGAYLVRRFVGPAVVLNAPRDIALGGLLRGH